jgi:hypothetical protein
MALPVPDANSNRPTDGTDALLGRNIGLRDAMLRPSIDRFDLARTISNSVVTSA